MPVPAQGGFVMNKKSFVAALAILTAVVVSAGTVYAEDGVNVQLFRPSVFGGNFISIDDSHTLGSLGFGGGLLISYGNSPFVLYDEDDEVLFDYLSDLYTAHGYLAFGPFSWVSLGVEVPVHINAYARPADQIEEDAESVESLEDQTVMGDILAKIKFGVLVQEKHWLGLAIAPYATFPTGDEEVYLGEGRTTGGGNMVLEHDFGVFNLGLNGGYLYRGENDFLGTTIGDAVTAGAGISREWDNGLSFSVEYQGHFYQVEDTEQYQGNPQEAMATLRYKFGGNGPRLIAGAGPGLSTSVGTPTYRVVGGVDYFYRQQAPGKGELKIRTVDQDGNLVAANLKISGVGGQLWDGKSDGKWATQAEEGKYSVAATADGYQPASGSAVVVDGETMTAELVLTKNKPAAGTLKVLVVDKYSGKKLPGKVVLNPCLPGEESFDNPSGERMFTWEPGTYKVRIDAVGYETQFVDLTASSGKLEQKVVKLRRIIEKIGDIKFNQGSDIIRKESYAILDDVVAKIKALGDFKKIYVQGHASAEGNTAFNFSLSKRRAEAVKKYLAGKGVPTEKLVAESYGETQPLAPNDSEANRAKNRRVEFVVEENKEICPL
jgi:outer membrane protein OmpA-like peptidoglycan-associated protein